MIRKYSKWCSNTFAVRIRILRERDRSDDLTYQDNIEWRKEIRNVPTFRPIVSFESKEFLAAVKTDVQPIWIEISELLFFLIEASLN